MRLLGAIAGDIIGSKYEFMRHAVKTKNFELFPEDAYFTDDSVLTIALADSIINDVPYTENLREYYKLYPDAGYGVKFREWCEDPTMKAYNSFGNGAAMRISPVGYAYNDIDTVLKKSEEFTIITHNHPEGIKGAQATALSIFLARNNYPKSAIKSSIEKIFGYNLDPRLDDIRPTYKFDESCQGTVPQSIIAFLESNDFEDAIRNAVSLGGDADTLACITGSIAYAYYGEIPKHMVDKVYEKLDDRIITIIEDFDKYIDAGGYNANI